MRKKSKAFAIVKIDVALAPDRIVAGSTIVVNIGEYRYKGHKVEV